MMRLCYHFGITVDYYKALTIEQYYNYLEEFSRFIDENKK